jgi:DNA (cytosine-5)-methyltransferase 1
MKILKRTPTVPGEPKASDLWRTPRALFEALDAEFAFDIDLAADKTNALVPRWLGPGGLEPDALAVDWPSFGRTGWLNPPYSTAMILRFMEAVARHSRRMTIVTLTPLDPSTEWWEFTRAAAEIRLMPDRVPYLKADGVTKPGAMFSSAVSIFRPQPGILRAQPRYVWWSWKTPEQLAKRRRRLPSLLEAHSTP